MRLVGVGWGWHVVELFLDVVSDYYFWFEKNTWGGFGQYNWDFRAVCRSHVDVLEGV